MNVNAKKLRWIDKGRVRLYRAAFVFASLLVTLQAIGAPRKF